MPDYITRNSVYYFLPVKCVVLSIYQELADQYYTFDIANMPFNDMIKLMTLLHMFDEYKGNRNDNTFVSSVHTNSPLGISSKYASAETPQTSGAFN